MVSNLRKPTLREQIELSNLLQHSSHAGGISGILTPCDRRQQMTDVEKIISSDPVDRTAALVTQQSKRHLSEGERRENLVNRTLSRSQA